MARILVDGEWYDELAPAALYETEFEEIVMAQASHLYPGYIGVRFKITIESETDSAQPDMALIEREYREWWVVEIEMAHHSFRSHILPQVRTLTQGVYGQKHVDYLCSQNPNLDRGAMVDMVKGRQPSVLVLVNSPQPEWQKELAPFGAIVTVFQVFRSDRNRHVFRANGDYPRRPVGIVSKCSFDPMLKSLLRVESPAGLGVPPTVPPNVGR